MLTTSQLPFDVGAMDFRDFAAFLRRSDPAFVRGNGIQNAAADGAERSARQCTEGDDSLATKDTNGKIKRKQGK